MKYAVILCYDGTDFCGWQRQAGPAAQEATVQQTVEQALHSMTGELATVVGSGRTDSGVHAAGQVAHFVLNRKEWDPNVLRRGLNSLLPGSIRVLDARAVDPGFHAQRSAIRKQYSYYFQQGPCAPPHLEPYSWWIQKPLALEAMRAAIADLVGEHDFKPFQASGAKPGRTTVRKILEAEVSVESPVFPGLGFESVVFVRLRLVGSGFLKQMVRGIAGTLLQVGEERRDPACFREILRSGARSEVGPTAPGRALWLERVWYPDHFGIPLTGASSVR